MIWRAVGRLVLVPIAFLLAMAAAGFVAVSLGLEHVTRALHVEEAGLGVAEALLKLVSSGAALAAGLSLVPALAVVIIGEIARIRSWLYYVLGGGAALAAIPLLARLGESGGPEVTPAIVWQVLATAGFSGGLIYWLLAGRRA